MITRKSTKKASTLLMLCICSLLINKKEVYATETNEFSEYSNFYYDPTADFKQSCYDYYDLLPDYIKNTMIEDGMDIHICGDLMYIENLYKSSDTDYCSGLCDTNTFDIYVESVKDDDYVKRFIESDTFKEYGYGFDELSISNLRSVYVLYHEIGHYLDYKFSGYNHSEGAINMRNKEIEAFSNTRFYKLALFNRNTDTLDINEYLAAAFACYILCPNDLKNNCPNTYAYISFMDNYFKLNQIEEKPRVL